LVLAREHALTPVNGAELLLHSDVPNSCGVASSSAVTVASLRAFALQYDLDLSPSEVARLAKIVEQQVLQVDGRATDAMASVLAESGELLVLSGSAGDLLARIPVPSDLEFVGIDTGTKSDGQTQGHWPEGEEERIKRFQDLFGMEASDGHRQELGDLMFRAHEDYASHGLSNEACDLVVATAMRRREAGGDIFGAKLTGRGGGGTVVLLGRYGKVWYEALRVKKALNEATGHSGHIFRWSSPGAESFGSIELIPKQE